MSLPSSMADFVPCDRLLQKVYSCALIGRWYDVKIDVNITGWFQQKTDFTTDFETNLAYLVLFS